MKFTDLMPDPRFLTHPQDMFKSVNGRPFAQSFARNLGDATFGKAASDYTNTHVLHDLPQQATPAGATMDTSGLSPHPSTQMDNSAQQNGWLALLKQFSGGQQ